MSAAHEALLSLMERSISNSASIGRTTSIAIADSGISFLPAALHLAFSSMPFAKSRHLIPMIGVDLQDAGIFGQIGRRLLAYGSRSSRTSPLGAGAAKTPVVRHIDPASSVSVLRLARTGMVY